MKRNVPFVEPHTSPFAFSTSTLIAPFPAVTTSGFHFWPHFLLRGELNECWVNEKNHLQNGAKIRTTTFAKQFAISSPLGTLVCQVHS